MTLHFLIVALRQLAAAHFACCRNRASFYHREAVITFHDAFRDFSNVFVVQLVVALVSLCRVYENLQQLEDRRLVGAFCKCLHRRNDQVELLLQVVEAD